MLFKTNNDHNNGELTLIYYSTVLSMLLDKALVHFSIWIIHYLMALLKIFIPI